MSWKLNVDFLGLAAPVPLADGRWLVVLPNLKRGSDPELGLPHHIDSHQALVRVSEDDVDDAATSEELKPRLRYTDTGRKSRLYELNQHFLALSGGGASVSLAEGEGESLALVPSIAEIEPRAAELDGSLLSDWYGERIAPTSRLAATVLLDRGRLRARRTFTETDGQPSRYQFLRGEGRTPLIADEEDFENYEVVLDMPRMADGYRLEVEVEEETATLLFGDSKLNEHELVVRPESPEAGLTVTVHNQELENVMGFEIDPETVAFGDIDFTIFYALSTGWPELRNQPLAVPYRRSTGGGGKNRPCMSPLYARIG